MAKWKQAGQLIAKNEFPVYKDLVTESQSTTTLSRLSGIPVKTDSDRCQEISELRAELQTSSVKDQLFQVAVRFAATSQEFVVTSVDWTCS